MSIGSAASQRDYYRVIMLITLHGALLDAASMQPISEAVARYLPISRQLHLELPGHGRRGLETHTSFTIDDLATDVCDQINSESANSGCESTIFVGESTGALVLAAAARLMNEPPIMGLFGEPPLSNGHGMRQVRSSLEAQNSRVSLALQDFFGWRANEIRDFRYLFSNPVYPSLIVHGLQREATESVPVHSVIEQDEIDSLPNHSNLMTCAMKDRGHRVLHSGCEYWAVLLKGVLMAHANTEWKRTRLLYP